MISTGSITALPYLLWSRKEGDKVYSLPITQGKYKEMAQAVAKNKGHHVDFAKVQERTSDEVSISKVQNIAKNIQQGLEKSACNTNNTSMPPLYSKGRSKSSSLSY